MRETGGMESGLHEGRGYRFTAGKASQEGTYRTQSEGRKREGQRRDSPPPRVFELPEMKPAYLRCGRSQVLLGKADELLKACGVFDRHVRKDLSIQSDVGLLEGIDESTVGHPLCSNGRADTRDPQLPEVPLSVLATRIGVGQALIHAFCR